MGSKNSEEMRLIPESCFLTPPALNWQRKLTTNDFFLLVLFLYVQKVKIWELSVSVE